MTDRIRYLDGLRGVLAIIVFVHHFFYAFCPEMIFGGEYSDFISTGPYFHFKLIALTPLNILFNPGMAIHFFFLLSGYVQTYNYFQKPDLVFLQKSFIKRYFRLAIPTLAVLLLVFIFHRLHWYTKELIPKNNVTSSWVDSLIPDSFNLFELIRHGLASCFSSNSRYYQILWTMPTELSNSWMVLVLLFITHQLKNSYRLFIFWIIIQLFVLEAYYSVAFSFGMLLCAAEKNVPAFKDFFSKLPVKWICLLVGLYFASYPFVGYKDSTRNSFYGPISFFEVYPHIISYLFGDLLLFCWLMHSNRVQEFLSKKPFQFFGKISFMLYLSHFFLLLSFSPWFYNAVSGSGYAVLLTGLASFIVISVVSYLLYESVDKPVVKYCSVYLKRFFGV